MWTMLHVIRGTLKLCVCFRFLIFEIFISISFIGRSLPMDFTGRAEKRWRRHLSAR